MGQNSGRARFYKSEHGTGADYMKLSGNGSYKITAREHVGAIVTEVGRWQQVGSVITFRPSSAMRGGRMSETESRSYEASEVEYRGKTFIAFNTEDAAGIAIPIEETKKELDSNPRELPEHVFFKTTARIYSRERKLPYPFRYIKPCSPECDK
jgi:hypothetical protein